jgi:hypothetical protein
LQHRHPVGIMPSMTDKTPKKAKKTTPKGVSVLGRPTGYTAEKADKICELIAAGMPGVAAAKACGVKNACTLFDWLAKHKYFSDKYARAREQQADYYADEIVKISDELIVEAKHHGEDVVFDVSAAAVARNRLRVDARKWYASKLQPKKYGDKLDATITGADGGPVQHVVKVKFV